MRSEEGKRSSARVVLPCLAGFLHVPVSSRFLPALGGGAATGGLLARRPNAQLEVRATRKPIRELRIAGGYPMRDAARSIGGSAVKSPPRNTLLIRSPMSCGSLGLCFLLPP